RRADRQRLIDALIDEGLWPADPPTGAEALPMSPALMEAIHRYLARTPSRLMAIQAEDLAGEERMVNLPGTVDQHPNWRRRLSISVDALFDAPQVRALVTIVSRERSDMARAQ